MIVDKELIGMNLSEKVKKGFYFGGLMKALFKDGYDSSSRVILIKNKESCSIIKYAQNKNKIHSLNLLNKYKSEYLPEEIKNNENPRIVPTNSNSYLNNT